MQGVNDTHFQAGPDYRAMLIPADGGQRHIGELAGYCGLTIIRIEDSNHARCYGGVPEWRFSPELPLQRDRYIEQRQWFPRCPGEPLRLPDYIPDVRAGMPAPLQLTIWKIQAIKLVILLERRGYVTRRDMKALELSPTRWCDSWHGYLEPAGKEGRYTHYIANGRTPDFRKQHPRNFEEIEDDWEIWTAEAGIEDLP
jgi:hypothetical protein